MANSTPEALPLTDGRAARSHRTRLAIIDALLRLLASGDLRPTTERIAAAAGVSTRSIFLHFSDVDSLFTEAVDRFSERTLYRWLDQDAFRDEVKHARRAALAVISQ